MMNAEEANEASLTATREEQKQIEAQFRAYLVAKYSDHLTQSVQEELWDKTEEWGSGSGYSDYEHYYSELASFADLVLSNQI